MGVHSKKGKRIGTCSYDVFCECMTRIMWDFLDLGCSRTPVLPPVSLSPRGKQRGEVVPYPFCCSCLSPSSFWTLLYACTRMMITYDNFIHSFLCRVDRSSGISERKEPLDKAIKDAERNPTRLYVRKPSYNTT